MVIVLFAEYLGSHEVGCAAECFDIVPGLTREAQVAYFGDDPALLSFLQNVLWFDVSVENLFIVHVAQPTDPVTDHLDRFQHGEDRSRLLRLNHREIAQVAVLHNHEDPAVV